MSDAELREMIVEIARVQKETSVQMRDTDARMKETSDKIKELGKQIGGLGNKFGSFTEGMANRSVEKVLSQKFNINNISFRVNVRKNKKSQEFDVIGYSNGTQNQAVMVEIKSHLNQAAIDQVREMMDDIFDWFPEHKDKEFQTMICYVDGTKDARNAVLKEGWHLLHVSEDVFTLDEPIYELEAPAGFSPRIYAAK